GGIRPAVHPRGPSSDVCLRRALPAADEEARGTSLRCEQQEKKPGDDEAAHVTRSPVRAARRPDSPAGPGPGTTAPRAPGPPAPRGGAHSPPVARAGENPPPAPPSAPPPARGPTVPAPSRTTSAPTDETASAPRMPATIHPARMLPPPPGLSGILDGVDRPV